MGSNNHYDPKMPQVGMTIQHDSLGSWVVLRQIASGPFSDVFVVRETNNKRQRLAMKCERDDNDVRRVLKLDVMVLKSVLETPGFPRFIAAGRTDYYKYCVMQLVGPDLGKLRRSLPDKRFSVGTALRVLQQTLQRLQALHDAGWLCRDVKAPNFAVGGGAESGTIYMLDFGFARKFRDHDGKVIPPRSSAALMGTFQYAPLASHGNKDQSRKDDLESWLYMAVELLRGPLPWAMYREHEKMAEYKRRIRHESRAAFFQGIPAEFDHIMTIIDGLDFYTRPDYASIENLLKQAATRLGFTLREPFEWQTNSRLLRKADRVGELGESHMASMRIGEVSDWEYDVDVTPPIERDAIEIDITPPIDCISH